MHARIDQLLNLRDGEPVEAEAAAHASQCSICVAELSRIASLRRRMQELPMLEAPSWNRMQERLAVGGSRGMSRYALAGIAAGVAVLTITTVLSFLGGRERSDPATAHVEIAQSAPSPSSTDLAELVDRSRQLEEMLRVLPARPVVERVTTAATIDTLQDRIQWLDLQLSYAPETGLSERQAERMWRERVELMDSLVTVRFAESGYMSF